MHFTRIFSTGRPVLSLEFFPPKTEEQLPDTFNLIRDLSTLNPGFMTVTYGAGGGTRSLTQRMTGFIHNELGLTAVAHLTCGGHSVAEIDSILNDLESEGIKHILALRGDPKKGTSVFEKHPEGFSCAAELTAHVRKRKSQSIAVAGYPETHREARSPESDIEYLKQKVDSGAEVVITQLFFDNSSYFSFVDKTERAGIRVPIVPGIMPIGNVSQLKRFTSMCGAKIPKTLEAELDQIEDDPQKVADFGIDYAIKQCKELLRVGVPGLHFYTLNRSNQIRPLIEGLKGFL